MYRDMVKRKIERIVKAYQSTNLDVDKVQVIVEDNKVILLYNEYTTTDTIESICTAFVGEQKVAKKDALALNVTNMLDRLNYNLNH